MLGNNIDAVVDQILEFDRPAPPPPGAGAFAAGRDQSEARRRSPDTPTLDELGLESFEVVTGSGLLAPAKTPPATVKILGDALQKVLDDPEVQAKLRGLGTEGRKMTPDQYDALLKKEDAGAAHR